MTFWLRPSFLPGFFHRAEIRAIAALAIPLVMSQLAHIALTTLDIFMLGMLDPTGIAAGGLALSVFNLFRATFGGLLGGTGNLIAEANALQNGDQVRQIARASLTLATLGALFSAAALYLAEAPLLWFGQDPAIARQSGTFLRIMAPAMFPCLWFQSLRQFAIGMRRPGPILLITLGCLSLNGLLDYALMFGHWGFPRLGLAGIAWATGSVYMLSCMLFLAVVLQDPTLRNHISLSIWRTQSGSLARNARMGLLVAATFGSETAFFAVVTFVIGTMGATSLAAQVIANQFVHIVFMVSSGISQATSICISQAVAQADPGKARRFAYTGLGLGLAIMLLPGIPYLVASGALVRPFLGSTGPLEAQVGLLAGKLLKLAAFMQLADCSQSIGVGALRGIGAVGQSFKMTLVGYWLVGLPSVLMLGPWFSLGPYGVWLGLSLGLGCTSLLLWRTFELRLAARKSAS